MTPDTNPTTLRDRAEATVDAPPAKPVRIPHAPGLDGLRGLAVAAVVVFHAGPANWMPGGFLGVSLFFTLSGYLITTLVLAEVQRDKSVGLASFWSRRVRRLIPALLLLTFGVAVMSRFTDLGRGIRVDIVGALTYSTNWIEIVRGQAYGDLFRAPSPLVHLWSLAIEEQFYLVLPFAAWLLARRAPWRVRQNLTIGAVAMVVIGFIAARLTHDPTLAYYGTLHRAPEIAIGALLATLTHPTTTRARPYLSWASLAAVVITVFAWRNAHVSDSWVTGGGLVLFAVVSATLVRGASRPGPASTFFSVRPFRALGLISYGLYLYHWPIVVLLSPPRVDMAPVPLFVVRVGISLALAVASYYLVEQRFRRGWSGTPPVKVIGIGIAALAVMLLVCLAIAPAGEGEVVASKPAPAVVDLDATTTEPPPGVIGPARVAIVGDSVPSWIIRDGGSGLNPDKIALIDGTLEACDGARDNPPARSITGQLVPTPPGCTGWPSQYPQYFERADDIAVLMVGGHAVLDRQIQDSWRGPCDPVAAQWYANDIRSRLNFLELHAAKVVLVLPTWAEDRSEWIYPRDHIMRMDCVRDTLRRAARDRGDATIDFGSYVCPDGPGACRPIRTHDGMHVDPKEAPGALVWLIDRVLTVTGTATPDDSSGTTTEPKPGSDGASAPDAPTASTPPAAPSAVQPSN